ncbi:short-chain dehydrogenase/reductase-like protein [Melanomma pulvis-pyrius CBS 109.77]|uniref:Short-chain dehydrogenase/reductase-like protein n=1 Tax=Melanomma pulvis-pyrius CBS 109.77 TaxID=1314802 RepID=A0A6A6XQU4_9PLEO|nr:short-chain dehydrogenase/reductase-like protein [Melanomma pulvis-pyrius CBS 109.77]
MSRYIESHVRSNLRGPGDARPTALQIISDENLVGKLSSSIFLVTGVSSGLGIETLRALHTTGAHVFGTVRNVAKGQKVVDEILAEKREGGGKIDLIEMELGSFASIRAGAAEVLEKSGGKLNVIVANAGIMAVPEGKTVDGWELQFGTNHLGHFLLFQLVKDALLASATPEVPSRYISVSSTGHRMGSVRLDDYNFEAEAYDPWKGYGQSKTANIWMANSIQRRYAAQNLIGIGLHPGGIITGLSAHFDPELMKAYDTPIYRNYFKSPGQGAATQVFAAVGEESRTWGGKWVSDCAVQPKAGNREAEGIVDANDDGWAEWAFDEAGGERLWKESFGMVGLKE